MGKPGWGEGSYAPPKSEMNNPTVEPIAKKYIELRYQLLSYNYTLAWQARATGMPMMRSMWLHYLKGTSIKTLIKWDDAAKRLTIEPQGKENPKRTFKIELIPDGTTKTIRYTGRRLEVSL
jgi:hypothetical protein